MLFDLSAYFIRIYLGWCMSLNLLYECAVNIDDNLAYSKTIVFNLVLLLFTVRQIIGLKRRGYNQHSMSINMMSALSIDN
ncbi:hypothetical protein C9J01_14220 [Photobacterium rosenbergii]|uniref:Uncharacterized protein n=1 Tax=Photobacterium rosenbergii TaxID=294936 RepID=A0A2T3NDK4_9GAMM|nr:hypothetical protein C9J01_14220 [Photobacterium rosenbergii]